MSDVTRILSQIEQGDPSAAEQLLPLVYDELRKLAAAKMAQEQPGQTLQATALVHEAYLRLVGQQGNRKQGTGNREERQHDENLSPDSCPLSPVSFDSRGHFFAAAAEAMRRILVENARRKASAKHGGERVRMDLDQCLTIDAERPADLLILHEALDRLAAEDPLKADLVKLRCFAGLTHQEAAAALGLPRATADRYWAYAKARLYCEIYETDDDADS